jgi:hypothetical protein
MEALVLSVFALGEAANEKSYHKDTRTLAACHM